jgi:hypothetical protein
MAKKTIKWKIIEGNLQKAREELERLGKLACDRNNRNEEILRVGLEHALHHINFAWNSRRIPVARVYKCATRDFNAWSRHPADLKMMRI